MIDKYQEIPSHFQPHMKWNFSFHHLPLPPPPLKKLLTNKNISWKLYQWIQCYFCPQLFTPFFGNLTLIKMGLNWRWNYINLGCLKLILTNIYNVTSVHRLGEIVILKISNKPLFSILSFRVWLNFLQLQYCNPYKYKMFGAYNGLYIGCSIGFS